jgi:Phage major capsid protein E
MKGGSKNFYDLVGSALGTLENYQGYLDNVMASKYNGLQMDGFDFAPNMQVGFTYAQIQKELNLNVMATYVDVDSDGKNRGTQGFQLTTGKIPRMKVRREYDETQMREIMVLQQRFGGNGVQALGAALNALFETTDDMIGSHTNSLTYQRHQMVSRGKLELLDTNNPNGIVNVAFSANVPAKNITQKTLTDRWWTSAAHTTEGTTSNPIKDMITIVRAARLRGITDVHFEVDFFTLEDTLNHSAVKTAIGYAMAPMANSDSVAQAIAVNLGYEGQKAALERLIKTPINVIDSIVSVEKWDNAAKALGYTQLRAFAPDVFVLVPNGSLGEILTVEPLKLPLNNGTYGDFYGGRLLLTVDFEIQKKIQYFKSEMTSLVVPNKPQTMYYLNIL